MSTLQNVPRLKFLQSALFAAIASLTLCLNASADEVITFDTDVGIFTNEGATSVTHAVIDASSQGGSATEGVLAVSAPGGYAGNGARAELFTDPALQAEFQAAVANGGTISYDVYVLADDVITTANPAWFESYAILNTGNSTYDQNAVGTGFSFPLTPGSLLLSSVSFDLIPASLDGAGETVVNNDLNLDFNPVGPLTFAILNLGTNNESPSVTSLTMYYDNVTISANTAVVPEPSSLAILGSIGLLGLVRRRR